MKSLEKKQKLFLAGMVLTGVLLVVFGYVPIAWQKYVIRKALARQSLPIEQVRESIEQAAVLEKQISQLEQKVHEFEQFVPQNPQFASLWRQIAELIAEHDLEDQQVRPGKEVQYADFNVVSLDIQCSGTLTKIYAFVRSLEQMDRLIRIESMELSNDKDLTGRLTLSAKAEAFYRTPVQFKAG